MSEDTQKIPVQISAETLRAISEAKEKAANTAEAQGKVTLQLLQEALPKLTKLREDITALEESQVADSHRIADRFIKTSEMRISFFEKLILLSGGSFALSLTFLGSLHRAALQGKPLAAMGKLETAWILLLVCIVFSWFHNLHRTAAVDIAVAANSTFINAMQHKRMAQLLSRAAALFKPAETPSVGFSDGITMVAQALQQLSKQFQESGTDRAKDFKRYFYVSAVLGSLALLAILVAFSLLIEFAIKNAALL
jgi:hypothetical protein